MQTLGHDYRRKAPVSVGTDPHRQFSPASKTRWKTRSHLDQSDKSSEDFRARRRQVSCSKFNVLDLARNHAY